LLILEDVFLIWQNGSISVLIGEECEI